MASLHPFRGTRYSPESVGDLSRVVAPPYDVISEEKGRHLASLSPYNVVRLTLPQPRGEPERFQASADLIDRWLAEGILAREEKPCMYVYRHEFKHDGRALVRTGLIAALDLRRGGVVGHEKTAGAPRKDRLRLLRVTRSSLGPIFMLYPDPDSDVRGLLEGVRAKEHIKVELEGERHTLGVISDTGFHAEVSQLLKPRRFLIADGHHRYGAALSNHLSGKEGGEEEEWQRSTMVYCVSMEDPGLLILPTHRLIRGLAGPAGEYLGKLGEMASVEPAAGLDEALAGMFEAGKGAFGLCTGDGGFYIVRSAAGHEDRLVLDVEILHALLDALLIGEDGSVEIDYTQSAREGAEHVAAGEASMCFLLQPVGTRELTWFSSMGRLMPPKTTYFHPKPLTGLVMKVDRAGNNLQKTQENA